MKAKLFLLIIFLLLLIPVSSVQAFNWPKLKKINDKTVEHYQKATNKYLKTVKNYQRVKKEYLNFREKVGVWKNLSEDQKNKHLDKAKEYLLKSDERAIVYLEKVKTKIQQMKNLDEAKKTTIIAEIDKEIQWLNSKKEEINNISSPEDLQNLSLELKNYWHQIRGRVKRLLGTALGFKFERMFNRMDKIRERINKAINQAKENGKQTEQLEEWLASFDQHLAAAKEKYQAAQADFKKISNAAEADALLKQANNYLKEAHQYLKTAYQDLKNITKGLKELK